MAELLDVRRHSRAAGGQPLAECRIRPGGSPRTAAAQGKSLSPEGIALAHRVAPSLVGNFHAAYTSPKPRCIETLAAFGFTTYRVIPEFSTLPDEELSSHGRLAEALQRRAGCSLLEAYMAIPATHLVLEKFGAAFFEKLCELAAELPGGRNALAVSHGGSIEPAVLAAMPDWTLDSMGGELAECEGALFRFEGGIFKGVELRRL